MRTKKIAPSIMCAPMLSVDGCLRELEQCGADLIHIDIMDGSFVPNYTLGTNFVKEMKSKTSVPLDIHLMIEQPEEKLGWFDIQPGEFVSVHAESTRHLQRALARVREFGAKPMVALNPATPLVMAEDVLDDVDAVLLMTVNPGFAGQKLVPQTLGKITRLRRLLDQCGKQHVRIEVDGNVSFENAVRMRAAGADMFVCCTSSIFSKSGTMEENTARFRACISGETEV